MKNQARTLFSTPELAQWLGVFHTTIRRWIEKGQINGIRIGRNYKVHANEVFRILNKHGLPLPQQIIKYIEIYGINSEDIIYKNCGQAIAGCDILAKISS